MDRLAGLLGHTVEVRSVVGRGSGFAVTVPRSNQIPAEQPITEAGRTGTPQFLINGAIAFTKN